MNSSSKVLTYADYCALDDDGKRYELMDGVLVEMTAPTTNHQIVLVEISKQIAVACDLTST
jgi:Uma2 family endonuclease